MGQKIQDSPLVWQMRPHTPEATALLLLIRLLLMLELFTSKAREEAGQLFLRSGEEAKGSCLQEAHRQQKRKLPSAGPEGWFQKTRRGPPPCHPLADPFTQHLIAVQVHNRKGPLTGSPCLVF